MNFTSPKITFLCVCVLLSSLKTLKSASICHPNDRKVLLQVKNHFHNASCFSTWMPDTDCCSWSGIKCDDNDDPNPGRVTVLEIRAGTVNNISGQIPPMIGDLPLLRKLFINFQENLTGPIPLSLRKLNRLEILQLCCNNLTGPIPDFWNEFKNLNLLGLHLNYFTGTIPSSLSLLPNISRLALFSNLLTGSIPESFGSFKTSLSLTLFNNQLSGTIPTSLGQANFTNLDVSYNQFTGDASFLFSRDKPLQQVSLRQNKFKFDFTNVDLPQGLRSIDIANNEIYGSLPKRLGQLPLKYIDVSNNHMCGRIPASRRLKRFDASYFSNNKCLCDIPLPPCK